MSTTEHSPLPWGDDVDAFGIVDCNGLPVHIYGSHNIEPANRRLIVTAVNSRVTLLAAAKGMLSAIASRDIPSFVWGSPRAEALKAAIAAAEEPAS
jgi:hypothetical protein